MKLQGNIVAGGRAGYGVIEWTADRISRLEFGEEIQPDEPWVLPGFIELHLHGIGKYNVEEGESGVAGMAAFAASKGTVRMVPAYACAPHEEILDWLRMIRKLVQAPPEGARISGAHLEGPWLSLRFGGGMKADQIRNPDPVQAQEYLDAAQGTLKLMTIAPELPGAPEVIRLMRSAGVTMSLGHSDCPPEFFETAVGAGISQVCHLFDAYDVPSAPLGVRHPAVTDLALIDDRVMKEIIMDGLHVPPELVKLSRRAAGADHIIAITDSLQGAGLPVGRFFDAGRPYIIREGELARLEADGQIVGSSLTMNRAFFNMTEKFGFTPAEAVKCLSANPAKQLGLVDRTGELREGLSADIAVLAPDRLTVQQTYLEGRRIF